MSRLLLVLLAVLLFYLWWRPPKRLTLPARGLFPLVGAGLMALAYVVSPIDLLPDVTPVGFLDDLIVIGTTIWWLRGQWQRRPQPQRRAPAPPPPSGDGAWDPYRVLEVSRGASRDELTRAYREQMKRYHPDKVSGLGDELQEVAHRRTLEIQRAYAELTG